MANTASMAANYDEGVQGVTQEDYCAKQIRMGVRPDVCAARFQDYKRRTVGKGAKMAQHWQNG